MFRTGGYILMTYEDTFAYLHGENLHSCSGIENWVTGAPLLPIYTYVCTYVLVHDLNTIMVKYTSIHLIEVVLLMEQ